MRTSSHAPSVRYPHGRSAAVGVALLVVCGLGLACIAAWLAWGAGHALGAKAAVGLGLWAASAAGAWRLWRSTPSGHLVWNGREWALECAAASPQHLLADRPQVHLDLQAGLLLSVQPQGGRRVWLWLERQSSPLQWLALRRAVYARVRAAAAPTTTDGEPSRRDGGEQTKI